MNLAFSIAIPNDAPALARLDNARPGRYTRTAMRAGNPETKFIHVERPPYSISTDPGRLDLDVVHGYLAWSYWAEGIPRPVVERSIRGALCFGVYEGKSQVGFARVITDAATYAYLGDVFVLESHRGRGLSAWLMEVIMAHPDLQGLRRFSLITRDAHGLYERYGFKPLARPEGHMEILCPGIYLEPND